MWFAIALAVTVAFFAAATDAGVVVDPNANGAADITNDVGVPIDPTTDISAQSLAIGFNNTGELLIDQTTDVNPLTSVSNIAGSLGLHVGSRGTATVVGAGSTWINSGDLFVGRNGTGTLNIEAGGVVSNTGGVLGVGTNSSGTVTVTGANSSWANNGNLFVGNAGSGTLNIEAGGVVSSTDGGIGTATGATGLATVTGVGSAWTSGGELFVGGSGSGTLNVEAGGTVSSTAGFLGTNSGATGVATVSGANSSWANSGELFVASSGRGALTIESGGVVSSIAGFLGASAGSTGTASVAGNGSTWTSNNLYVGGSGTATGGSGSLTVRSGAVVSVADTLKIWDGGVVNLDGGSIRLAQLNLMDPAATLNFRFGTLLFTGGLTIEDTLASEFNAITRGQDIRVGGQLTLLDRVVLDGGRLSVASIINPVLLDFVSGTLALTNANLDVTATGLIGDTLSLSTGQTIEVTHSVDIAADGRLELAGGRLGAGVLVNNAVIQGHGRVDGRLNNAADGRIIASAGNQILFTAAANTNDGTVDLLGGAVEFQQTLTNSSSGRINGRGVLTVSGGLNHQGEMNLSGGFTDVFGTVALTDNARIIVSGGATATFFDDVSHNGSEIRSSAGSATTFFGAVTGAGNYTGPGTVNFEGTFSVGNSPGEVGIEGDAVLGSGHTLILELAGLIPGVEYDHVTVAGHLAIDGRLDVRLLDGFTPRLGDAFDLLDFGSATGLFDEVVLPALGGGLHFDDGLLLTTGVLTVVPEPATAVWLGGLTLFVLRRQRPA